MSLALKSVRQSDSRPGAHAAQLRKTVRVESESAAQHWLSGVSNTPKLSIGQVVDQIRGEFPSVQGSKLRYMEEQGIIRPHRGANGYRLYSQADVEKIRFALSRQRDSYMPWSKIRSEIEILDNGGALPEVEPTARVVATDGVRTVPEVGKRLSVRQLLDYSGASGEQLEKLVKAGLLTPDLSGRFSGRALPVLIAYLSLENQGIQARNLRSLRSAANGATDLIEQVVAPTLARGASADKERARGQATALAAEFSTVICELLAIGVENIT